MFTGIRRSPMLFSSTNYVAAKHLSSTHELTYVTDELRQTLCAASSPLRTVFNSSLLNAHDDSSPTCIPLEFSPLASSALSWR